MLKANISRTFNISRLNLSDRILVKTGSYADGNCFFHALLRAIDINYRRQTTYYAHLRIVEKFRNSIVEWLTFDIYKSLGNGEQMKLNFTNELRRLLEEEYQKNNLDQERQIIFELIPFKLLDDRIIPESLSSQNFYLAMCSEIEMIIRKKLESHSIEKINYVCEISYKYFIDIFQQVHHNSFQNFKNNLQKMGEFVDSLQMECISRYTGYNFLFVYDDSMEIYKGSSHIVSFETNRQTLIFLWVNENHFEIIGEKEEEYIINRIFNSQDELIVELAKL